MRYKIDRNHKITSFLCLLLGMILLTGSMCIPVYAAEYWPEGPEVVSPNVIVMEACLRRTAMNRIIRQVSQRS